MSERERKLEELGYPLSDTPGPGAIYRPIVIDGTTAYLSGTVPFKEGRCVSTGKVGSEVSLEEGQQAAARCVANLLRIARAELGSLDRIERVIRLTGYVHSDPGFTEQHKVVNGASELLLEVLGEEAGLGARSAVGVAQLPLGASVEAELILKITPA